MELQIPQFSDIQEAARRIKPYVHRTPVLKSKSINKILNADIYFKCENFQKAGAFKFRGASNAVFSLLENQIQQGVGTHSSGNHAAALALAARIRGIKAYIVMPENAPVIKKKAVEGYGGIITFCKPTLESRESTLMEIIDKTGATEIHPYSNFNVISGQGTAALELLEEIDDLQIIMTPVGGGGLLSGTTIVSKAINPKTKVIATEPAGADDAWQCFKSKTYIAQKSPNTIADGLKTSVGPVTFHLLCNVIDDVATVSEQSILEAMRLIWERMKIIIEPSSAVPLAALLEKKLEIKGQKVGIILSGGNVDLENLPFGRL